jgi:PiT family inorganic phosphate transporter
MVEEGIVSIAVGAIIAALFFDFVNGFHDSANAIATVVGTRVLKPLHAVSMAAVANFAGPFIFGTAIAATVGKGIIQPEFSTVYVILAGLIGAIIWDLITWYFGLPSSSSHALIGGLVGSALIAGGLDAIVFGGVEKTLIFMVVSPTLGFVIAFAFAIAIMYFLRSFKPRLVNGMFGRLQIGSSIFFSLSGAAASIALGTFLGGWRIVKTMAFRLTQLRPYQGFCAETGGGAILTSMAWLGIPVSTTHAISGAIMGVGATKRLSAVRWGVGKRLIYAWIITIPASAGIAAIILISINHFIGIR